jgi:hypothetical protein
MNYKEWLQKTLGDMLKARDDRINLQVYEHSNAKFTGGVYDCSIVINDLGGTTDNNDISVLPVQLMCLSCGQLDEDGNENTTYDIFYEVLKEFCQSYNRQSMILNDFDYYRMTYVLPLPINPLEADSATFRMNFVVSGTLTISQNISDISKIRIYNQEVPFLIARLTYATTLSSSKKMNQVLTRNRVTNSSLTLSIDCYNRNNVLGNIFKSLRNENRTSNQSIKCNIIFNDGQEEEHYFVVSSISMTSDKVNPSVTTYEFALY